MNKNITRLFYYMLAIVILSISIYYNSIIALQMSDENLYANLKKGVTFTDVSPGGASDLAGIHVDDILLKINGEKIESARYAQSFLDKANAGESLVYTIQRGEDIFDVTVNLALAGLRIWHVSIILVGIIFLALALFIITSKPDHSHARLLALNFMMVAFFLMNSNPVVDYVSKPELFRFLSLVILVNVFFTVAVFTHSFHYFPAIRFQKINRWLMIYLLYIVAGIGAVTSLVLIFKSKNIPNWLILIMPALSAFNLLFNWKKRTKEFKERNKINFYSGIFLFLLSFLIFFLIQIRPHAYFEYFVFAFIIWPLSYFYTIIKYRIFDISIRIHRSLIYAIIKSAITVLFLIAIMFLAVFLPMWKFDLPVLHLTGSSFEVRPISQLSPLLQTRIQTGYIVFFGVIMAFTLYFLKKRIQNSVDRIFFQQKYDYRVALKNFLDILSGYMTRDSLSQHSIEQIAGVMKVKGSQIALTKNGKFIISSSNGVLECDKPEEFTISAELRDNLIKNKKQVYQPTPENFTGLDRFHERIYCATPVFSGGQKIEGILFTGEKLSESAYNLEDFELLNFFAEHLGSAFERARLYEEMADKERLKRELEIAREIQLNSLPAEQPNYPGLQIYASLSAAHEVGGDYYDYLPFDQNRLGIIIGDVVGKGTSAAFYMSKIQGFVQSLQNENLPSLELLDKLNILIRKNFKPDFFFTALYGVFDITRRQLEIFRLGHNGLIYYNAAEKRISVLEPEGIGFGLAEKKIFRQNVQSQTISYHEGDVFVFLTDGFLEAMNESGEVFGETEIIKKINSLIHEDAQTIIKTLMQEILTFSNDLLFDDATGIVVKIA